MNESDEKQTLLPRPSNAELVAFCEKIAYDRKAEDMIRLDMKGIDGAQADFYLICNGLSTPHIGSIAERIQRELRNTYGIRPLKVDGAPQSQWIIADFGFMLLHVMTKEAREKYQLESLWSDAPREDVVARLDEEYKKQSLLKKSAE